MGIPNFREMRTQIEQMRVQKQATFPFGSMVEVNSDRFHGIGIAVRDESCPLEQLAVYVESLNTWWYPMEDCKPYHGKMPTWIRSQMRQWKMKRVDSEF